MSPEEERERVISAALTELRAREVSPLTREACLQDNPDAQPCIELESSPDELVRGLARFTGGDPEGGPFTFFMGRMDSGEWGYWLGTRQMTYVLDGLPGDLLMCGSGEDVMIVDAPNANAGTVTTLPSLTAGTSDRFVLAEPGSSGVTGQRGEGWYHLVSPVEGWVLASLTTAAALGDCLLHDEVEGRPRG